MQNIKTRTLIYLTIKKNKKNVLNLSFTVSVDVALFVVTKAYMADLALLRRWADLQAAVLLSVVQSLMLCCGVLFYRARYHRGGGEGVVFVLVVFVVVVYFRYTQDFRLLGVWQCCNFTALGLQLSLLSSAGKPVSLHFFHCHAGLQLFV